MRASGVLACRENRHAAPLAISPAHHPVRCPHRHASGFAHRRHRHCRALYRPRGPAAAGARHSAELRVDPAAVAAAQDQGAAGAGREPGRYRGFRHHLRSRLADVARGHQSRRRPAELPGHAFGKDQVAAGKHRQIEGAAKGRRGLDRPAGRTQRSQRQAAGADRRHQGRQAGRQANSGRDYRARADRLGALSDDLLDPATAAGDRRHRAAVRDLHSAAARRFARPVDPSVRRRRPATRHLHHERRSLEAQPLFSQPGADQLRLRRADRRRRCG